VAECGFAASAAPTTTPPVGHLESLVDMDKCIEKQRARAVVQRFPRVMRELGFSNVGRGGYTFQLDGHTCHVGLQKFTHQPAFRIIMSFEPSGGSRADLVCEVSDPHTYRDTPSGRKYDFNIRWGDDAVERCVAELADFVRNVAMPWFVEQAHRVSASG